MADGGADQIKEQIKFEVEWLKLTAIAVLAVGGGAFSLLLGELNALRLVLAIGGLLWLHWGSWETCCGSADTLRL